MASIEVTATTKRAQDNRKKVRVRDDVPPYNAVNAVLNGAGPNPDFCYGFESANTNGYYITTMKIATGVVELQGLNLDNDLVLPGIVAYDRAERNEAYIGQVNMITVSSFSGPLSAIWGYDMAKVDPAILRGNKLFEIKQEIPPGTTIPVYSMEPLIGATQELFGTEHDRKFPVVSGGHVPCAVKSQDSIDPATGKPAPGWVWCYLSIAIAERRGVDASLFIEDAGFYPDKSGENPMTAEEVELILLAKARQVAYSQVLCGQDQSVPFTEIFMSWRKFYVAPGQYGTALTCAPYISLAQKVYPSGTSTEGSAQQLIDMSLDQWKKATTSVSAPQPTIVKMC